MRAWRGPLAKSCSSPMCGSSWSRTRCATWWHVWAIRQVGGASGHIVFVKSDGGGEADVGLYWRYEKWLRDKLTAVDSLLVATGCVYALRRELARPLRPDALIDDAYLPLAAIFAGYRFVFERRAIAYDYPTELDVEFQRKVRTLAGLFQLVTSYPRLLNVFAPVGFHFFSYKLGRLLLPYAFLLMAASGFWLPRPWAEAAVGGQLVLYGLAAVDHWIPAGLATETPVRGVPYVRGPDRCGLLRWVDPVCARGKPMEGDPRESGKRKQRGAGGRLIRMLARA